MRNKTMINTTNEQFSLIVQDSFTYSEICNKLGLRVQGSNFNTIKNRILKLNLSTSHFNRYKNRKSKTKTPINELLVENSHVSSNALKIRLIKDGILINKCNCCGNKGVWNEKPLTLQLDHKNGNHKDNRLENLQILCPNCHSQTDTHSGKRFKLNHKCKNCGKEITNHSKLCKKCNGQHLAETSPIFQTKIPWPHKNELENIVWQKPTFAIAKELNTSHNGLINHCKKIGIKLPPQGYWSRRNNGYSHEESLKSQAKIRKPLNLLTNEQVKEIRVLFSQGMGCRKIGRKLGLCHTKISAITRGKSYVGIGEINDIPPI